MIYSQKKRIAADITECRRKAEMLIPALRHVAARKGYALDLHGSVSVDIDILAFPWTQAAVSATELAESVRVVCEAITGMGFFNPKAPERKPHGRLAWAIHIGSGHYIDLSVGPRKR